MKQLFISQPFRGRTEEEVFEERAKILSKVEAVYKEEFSVIDQYHQIAPEGAGRFYYLSQDILMMDKKKDNRAIIDGPDPDRWIKEDIARSKKTIDASSDLITNFKNIEQASAAKQLDLSKMTDKELRDQINRKLLEQQYTKLYADVPSAQVSKGQAVVKDTLEVAGNVLSVAGSVLSIALAIKELMGQGD